MKTKAVVGRLVFLSVAAGTAFVAWKAKGQPSLNQILNNKELSKVTSQVKGVTDSLDIDTSGLIDQAQKKLIDSQPIMKEISSTTETNGEVKGVSDQAKIVIQEAANKAISEIQDIPREQAIKTVRTMCDQIVTQLEKGN